MTQFVILKKAGEPGKVAVNPAMVTEVRSASGPYIDVHFGDHRVAVEGSLQHIIALLSRPEGAPRPGPPPPADWLTGHPTP
ncbi:MAG: hypothetical protein JWO25_1490 [Alphaproteobacteria bacterium]|nr:hypothetical protein [Alphaproteobacteria bacterium]